MFGFFFQAEAGIGDGEGSRGRGDVYKSRVHRRSNGSLAGKRLMQAASDLFLGWCTAPKSGRKYYVRQMWDVKGQSDPMAMTPSGLSYYAALCAWTLSRAHARTGDAAAIAGYLGKSNRFDRAMVEFSTRYAAVNEKDHARLCAAIRDGRVRTA